MTTPSALSPEQSPEQSRGGSADPSTEQERPTPGQEPDPIQAQAPHTAPADAAGGSADTGGSTGAVGTGNDETGSGTDHEVRSENELRALLGLGPVGWVEPRAVRIRGWIATGAVGVIAALLRLVGLSHPKTLMFDEIYYVKDAYALWHLGYEANWAANSDAAFASGDFSGMSTQAAYVVHPQLGKWLIGAGMELFGPSSSFGWRVMPAVAGILTVMLLARLTMRLTRSPLLAGLAGLFLAIDGVALTESRIGLLDVFIGFFATLSLYFLVRDRQWSRARLARRMAWTSPGARPPHATIRPWLLATGVALGLTCSIKWSGLYLVAVVGVVVVVWDTLALRRVGARAWFLEGTVAQGVSDFLQTVPVAAAVYVGCWWSWFIHPRAYKHGWALEQIENHQPVPFPSLPHSINDFIAYHQQMYEFHVGLASPHTYQSKPYGWLLQTRPTSFYWEDKAQVPQTCWGGDCIQAITSIGNIVIWWSAVVALAAIIILGVRNRDWRAWAPLIGYLGLYVPWFQYRDRTIFTFYTVAFVPCVVLVLVLALGMAAGLVPPLPGSKVAQAQVAALRNGQIGAGVRPWRGVGARFLGFGPQFGRTPTWTPPVVETDPGMYRISTQAGDAPAEGESDAPDDDVGTGSRADQADAAQAMAELTGYPAPDSPGGQSRGDGHRTRWRGLASWTMVPTWQIRSEGIALIIVVTMLACAASAFWWPIWTGQNVSRTFWLYHMFLSSWI
ncbi:phospholipid carrier-dependent glycosyltransferase [Actinomyces viscosus]|uniref:Polyprenol-phosphate-mannose--protein mannosyltransferase n=1 Tax=Actinomyces viscosus TaxID=1656 RepID=A0A448PPB3_ACTVI|nr:phospholipid carrier-dependent glycosyltransferase [Actinomyces viscosus]TFH52750.1 phospholipid carrier-dependent glycosyltransferase [Actinomyces viscosus]VEI18246.1 Predicted membrane-bound dolichyl-phosphate-mannose-protein mannosyltransferase [Actinomyces viscosus]